MEITRKMKDISGHTYGSLTALRPVGRTKHQTVLWEFQCKCGSLCTGTALQIRAVAKQNPNPDVPSCGCVKNKKAGDRNRKHGLHAHPLYNIWLGMVHRCHTPSHKHYVYYGAKGVTVCEEWRNSPEAFVTWALSNGWVPGMDVDKDILSDALQVPKIYSPETCSIVTPLVNQRYAHKKGYAEAYHTNPHQS